VLRIEGVHAGYGRTEVLHGVTLEVDDGDMIAVLGRNGVGKTTLLKTIIGQVPVKEGRILLGDRDLSRARPHQRAREGVAYVPQGRDIFPRLTVLDNLRVAAFGTRQRSAGKTLEGLLGEFPILREKASQPGASLSGGQQQILALARALMTNPRVLLLDEPSEGIQPSIVDQIADTVTRINAERGITVVLVEQNLDFATKIARHAYLMAKGEIVRDLAAQDMLGDRSLQHEYLGV
jgi:branched-chain amino acid transport system ATP-binding protein/urea transport system ATP-binding protein